MENTRQSLAVAGQRGVAFREGAKSVGVGNQGAVGRHGFADGLGPRGGDDKKVTWKNVAVSSPKEEARLPPIKAEVHKKTQIGADDTLGLALEREG